MDARIEEAINSAVAEAGQSKALAKLIAAWFRAAASGNEKIDDTQAANRHVENLYEEVRLPAGSGGIL